MAALGRKPSWAYGRHRKPNAFWLHGRFYPDCVVMLKDGRIAVVEYKGKHLAEEAKEKRLIGELWAEASGGQCLFDMPTGTDFASLDTLLRAPVEA